MGFSGRGVDGALQGAGSDSYFEGRWDGDAEHGRCLVGDGWNDEGGRVEFDGEEVGVVRVGRDGAGAATASSIVGKCRIDADCELAV